VSIDDRVETAPGPNYLGDINQVILIVGGFVDDVLAAGMPAEKLCYRMARVFTGQEPGYTPMAIWNTGGGFEGPPRIVRHLTDQIQGLPTFPTPQQTVATAFGVLANRVLDTHEAEGDGAEWERRSTTLVQMFARMLVGLPQLPTR
jgi:hypothetical protein